MKLYTLVTTLGLLAQPFSHSASAQSNDVLIELRDGKKLEGVTTAEWKLNTTFGKAEIAPELLSPIDFGDAGKFSTIETSDGTTLKGKFRFDELEIQVQSETKTIALANILRLIVIQAAEPKAAEITNGRFGNGLTYHLRVPADWNEDQSFPALVIFHGSNTNSKRLPTHNYSCLARAGRKIYLDWH